MHHPRQPLDYRGFVRRAVGQRTPYSYAATRSLLFDALSLIHGPALHTVFKAHPEHVPLMPVLDKLSHQKRSIMFITLGLYLRMRVQ